MNNTLNIPKIRGHYLQRRWYDFEYSDRASNCIYIAYLHVCFPTYYDEWMFHALPPHASERFLLLSNVFAAICSPFAT